MRATWAPRGKTPVLTHHFNWKRLSMASALAFAPDGSDASLVFSMRAGSFNPPFRTLADQYPANYEDADFVAT